MEMRMKKLKYWGWGHEGEMLHASQAKALLDNLADFGIVPSDNGKFPDLDAINLPRCRIAPPATLQDMFKSAAYERVLHSFGQSQPDSIRIYSCDFAHAPDLVAYPGNAIEVAEIQDWCGDAGIAVIPYGGGSSVVGGVTGDIGSGYNGTAIINMSRMKKVLEIDDVSRAARIQGGTRGPELEAQLKPSGLTLRHFPQSFEHSTFGGWVATRSGGHFATLYTHIDDLIENVTMVTPSGEISTRRLPGSGAGPSPDRFMMGSEGALGIITEGWARLQGRPVFKATAGFLFERFFDAAKAVRAVSQAGLYPANVRIVDGVELKINGAGDGSRSLMVVSFENSDHPVDAWMARADECCRDHGGIVDVEWRDNPGANLQGTVGDWREAFIRMPYNREFLTPLGIISDTFETAITWERFENFHDKIKEATELAIMEATGLKGAVSCRFSHSYPDGPAPYFAFHAQGRKGELLRQWREIKNAASQAVIEAGGTITHHHAIGRDHQEWYEKQRPELFGDILGEAKSRLDPRGIMNPGVIVR